MMLYSITSFLKSDRNNINHKNKPSPLIAAIQFFLALIADPVTAETIMITITSTINQLTSVIGISQLL